MAGDELLAASDSDYSDATETIAPLCAYGHKYHHSGKVFTPCDESVHDVEQLVHDTFKALLHGALTTVPLPDSNKPLHIVDIGTGTGLWALDMGAAYPFAQVTGIDISPILLPTHMPRNVSFEVEDLDVVATADDCYDDDHRLATLDLVHIRNLTPGGIRDWPALLRRVYRWIKPGGWIEIASHSLAGGLVRDHSPTEVRHRFIPDPQETAGAAGDASSEPPPTPPSATAAAAAAAAATRLRASGPGEKPLSEAFVELASAWFATSQFHGVNSNPERAFPEWLSEAGFEKVTQSNRVIPIRRAKGIDASSRLLYNLFWTIYEPAAMNHFYLRYLASAGNDEEKVRALLRQASCDLRDPRLGAYGALMIASARKPLTES